jgi:hypothetical protein
MADTQISAHISQETKEKVERYAAAHGVKKGALVEQALLHHLQALHELPADLVIPPRLVLRFRISHHFAASSERNSESKEH